MVVIVSRTPNELTPGGQFDNYQPTDKYDVPNDDEEKQEEHTVAFEALYSNLMKANNLTVTIGGGGGLLKLQEHVQVIQIK